METSFESSLEIPSPDHLVITEKASRHLTVAANWSIFLSIAGLFYAVLIIFTGLARRYAQSLVHEFADIGNQAPSWGVAILYVLAALILYLLPSLFLLQFAVKAKKAVYATSELDMAAALEKLKTLFVFSGVITVLLIAFTIVFAVVMYGMRNII